MRIVCAALLFFSSLTAAGDAQTMNHSMAQTGFSGLLRIPHADALPFGGFSFNYQSEDNVDDGTYYTRGAHNTILMGVGLLPGLEFTVQNTHKKFSDGPGWNRKHFSDLSFSAKYDFKPFLPAQWFSLAVGMQDYGGAASSHKNLYAVASKAFFAGSYYHFRLSAGYGQGGQANQMGADYLQGEFAGIEWQPLPWLQLVSDYDGTGANAGIKLFTDPHWLPYGWQANFTYQSYSQSATFNRDNRWWGLGLSLPLAMGVDAKRYTVDGVNEWTELGKSQQAQITTEIAQEQKKQGKRQEANLPSLSALTQSEEKAQQSEHLLTVLVNYGFENVRTGWRDNHLVVSLENNLFNKNELDGIGVALGLIVHNSRAEFFEFHLLNNQIDVLNITGNSQQYRDYLQQTAEQPIRVHGLQISTQALDSQDIVWFSKKQASGSLVPRVIFSPHLYSSLGTELGVFDYSLALSSNVQLPLWKGGVIDVRHLLPVTHSDSYEDGEFFAGGRHKSQVDRILFHQAVALPMGVLTQFSVGQIANNYKGVVNETRWESQSGRHRVKTEIGDFSYYNNDYDYQPVLASYRYYLRALDLALEGSYGQYWSGDLGGSLSIKQWFGDMSVNITYQNSTCDRAEKQYSCSGDGYVADHEYAGLVFQFPIGTRKNASPAIGLQVKTLEQWGFGYRSRINYFANYIGGNRTARANLQYNVDQQYFNRDRLSKTYIESHMQRLRESYIKYVN